MITPVNPYISYSDRLEEYSKPIHKWATDNNIWFLDFDETMWTSNQDAILENVFEVEAKKYSKVALVESHPFFKNDEKYAATRSRMVDAACANNVELIFLTADYALLDNPTNDSAFFPAWYFSQRFWANKNNYKSYKFSSHKPYNFSCCNMANLRTEKLYNYIECFRKHRDDWCLTIYDHPHQQITQHDIRELSNLKEDQIAIWNSEIKPNVKMYEYDLLNGEPLNAHSVIFRGHTDAYCNLVMEHSMEIAILSEKSFKPFVAEQIPIYLAFKGAAGAMSKLGFDLFYDFFDHTQYDSLNGFSSRIDAVHGMLDDLYQTDFIEFIHRPDVIERKLKNKEHFYSNSIDTICVDKYTELFTK